MLRFDLASGPSQRCFFFKDGQVVDQVFGAVSKKVLEKKLNALLYEGTLQATEAASHHEKHRY